jgi:hypothetical protein
MNAQVQISYPELIAALDYERKHSAKLEEKLAVSEKYKMTYKANLATEKMNRSIAESKLAKAGISRAPGVSDDDEKKIIIDELRLNVKKRKDAIELLDVLLQLRDVDKFWRVVKTQSIGSIATILTGMKTQEGFDLVLSKIKYK